MTGIYIDMGSTNTRVWMMRDQEVLASARAQIGVADSAREGSTERVRTGLKDLIAELRADGAIPSFAIGAGMIGSSLGLHDTPHLIGPAGEMELAASIQAFRFPEIADLPFFIVPGIRFAGNDRAPISLDMMRGEETLCVGLSKTGQLDPDSTLLNLGSHWKAITLDGEGRIVSSVTSLSGELLQAARAQTILASSVPPDWPDRLDHEQLEAGIEEQKKAGLSRALFCVRLLHQNLNLEPARCFAFLCGAFIGADLENLFRRDILRPGSQVVISGSHALGSAWQHALAERSIRSTLLQEPERERALLAALQRFALSKIPNLKSPI